MGDIHLPPLGFIALDWSLLGFALIFVAFRVCFRRHKRPSLASNISDAFVVLAWTSGAVLASINAWKNSLRKHYEGQPDLYYGVPKDLSAHLLKVSWISLFFIYISLWSSKAAFIAFYYHLFSSNLGKWCQFVKAFVSVFTFLTFLLHMMLLAFWCAPVSLNWNINGHLCSAVHNMKSVTISTFVNVGTDLLIIMLPIVLLRQLTIKRADVWVYVFVLFIGSISIVAALVRYGALRAVWGQPKAEVTHTIDVWAMVEIVTSLIAVCLPAVRAFWKETAREKFNFRSNKDMDFPSLIDPKALEPTGSKEVGTTPSPNSTLPGQVVGSNRPGDPNLQLRGLDGQLVS